MSQDKSSDPKPSVAKSTGANLAPQGQTVGQSGGSKPGKVPVAVSDPSGADKRKESAIAQPVDALRRLPDKTVAQNNAGVVSPTNQELTDKNHILTETEADAAKTAADTTGKAGAMNSYSDKKTDNKSDNKTHNQANAASAGQGAGSGAKVSDTASSTGSNQGTKPSTGKQPPIPNAANSGNKPNKPNRANGAWAGLILGLVLVAVALGVGLWWQQQRFEGVAKEVATRLQQSNQQATQASERASQALTLATAQREVVDQLRRELSVVNNDLAALQQAWESANEGLDQTLLLNDLKRLITMANQELVLFGNVNSAVSILSSVDSMLQSQSAPALKNLQQAVIQDLARLRAVPQVDVASLSARLDSLIQLTNEAPLLAPAGAKNLQVSRDEAASGSETGAVSSASPSTAAGDKAWWASWETATGQIGQWSSEASEVLLREFANVLSIRKADDPQALLLSEDQARQLKANVRAMLLSAQLALMTRQAEIWRSELTEVQSLLNTRYDTDALDTKASLQLVGELLQAPLAADVPQIAQTLNALASAERVVTIPAADSALPDQQSTDESATESITESTEQPPAAGNAAQSSATEASGDAADTDAVSTEPTSQAATTGDVFQSSDSNTDGTSASTSDAPSKSSTSSANTEQGS